MLDRIIVLMLVIASSAGFGWVFGARHVQDEWNKSAANDAIIVSKQKDTAKRIESNHKEISRRIGDETRNLISRSDDHFGRLRYPTSPRILPEIPGSTGGIEESSKTDAPDPGGNHQGNNQGNGCSESDGAADAIVILGWQKLYREWAAQYPIEKQDDQ